MVGGSFYCGIISQLSVLITDQCWRFVKLFLFFLIQHSSHCIRTLKLVPSNNCPEPELNEEKLVKKIFSDSDK